MEYAKHQFKLVKPSKGGATNKELLEQIERQTGRKPKELEGPEFPSKLAHTWSAFLSLNDGRTFGQVANPITYESIESFCKLTHTVLSPRDIEVIKEVDKVYLEIMNKVEN